MKGLHLRSLTGELHRVADEYGKEPARAIETPFWKLGKWNYYIEDLGYDKFNFMEDYHRLPLQAFEGFSFDEMCKLYYTAFITMDKAVDTLFETKSRYEVVRKIESSMWRWGISKGTWNEVVDAYENIRRFTFSDNPDFEIRLDHSTYYNEFSHGKYSRIYIDGVFAYLVYYKRKHVMTIGFSILDGRKVLIQQVQSAKRSGNRWLYKLPKNRVEFVIDLFRANFLGYKLYLLDGKHLMDKTLGQYQEALRIRKGICERYKRDVEKSSEEDRAEPERCLRESEQARKELEEKIAHLEADTGRLVSFYKNLGRYRFDDDTISRFGMDHYELAMQ